MSMTNTIVGNCDSGVGSVCIVKLPGQSHISRGITVLNWAFVNIQAESNPRLEYRLVSGFDHLSGRFYEERILWREALEENLLD